MDLPSAAARGAETIHRAFDEHHSRLRSITREVRRRFEERDWEGIRRDTVEKLDLPSRSVGAAVEASADSSRSASPTRRCGRP